MKRRRYNISKGRDLWKINGSVKGIEALNSICNCNITFVLKDPSRHFCKDVLGQDVLQLFKNMPGMCSAVLLGQKKGTPGTPCTHFMPLAAAAQQREGGHRKMSHNCILHCWTLAALSSLLEVFQSQKALRLKLLPLLGWVVWEITPWRSVERWYCTRGCRRFSLTLRLNLHEKDGFSEKAA